MKYIFLILVVGSLLSLAPSMQAAHAQNILDQITSAFKNLTGGGANKNNTGSQSGAAGSNNKTEIGNINQLQNLTKGNQQIMQNNTPISNPNASLTEKINKDQLTTDTNASSKKSDKNPNTPQ